MRFTRMFLSIVTGLVLVLSSVPAANAVTVPNRRACVGSGACRAINRQSTDPRVPVECRWENPILVYRYPYSYRSCSYWV